MDQGAAAAPSAGLPRQGGPHPAPAAAATPGSLGSSTLLPPCVLAAVQGASLEPGAVTSTLQPSAPLVTPNLKRTGIFKDAQYCTWHTHACMMPNKHMRTHTHTHAHTHIAMVELGPTEPDAAQTLDPT